MSMESQSQHLTRLSPLHLTRTVTQNCTTTHFTALQKSGVRCGFQLHADLGVPYVVEGHEGLPRQCAAVGDVRIALA